MNGQASKKWTALVLIIVLVLILLGIIAWRAARRGTETVTRLESGDELVTAAKGQVVSGFPDGLLLEPGALVDNSYSLHYVNDNLRQPVVEYASGHSLAENIQMFHDYLAEDGWELTHAASLEEAPVTYFYAVKGDAQVNITFVEAPDYKVTVNIAYAEKTGK